MEHEHRSRTERWTVRLPKPSLFVVLWAIRRAKRGEDQDRPQIVGTSAASAAVLDRAKQFASDDREDMQAVAELRALASDGQRTLRQAERASRYLGYHHEFFEANLTNRLLNAALARKPVQAVVTRDAERIEIAEMFTRLSRSEQWSRLTQIEPALLDLEREVRDGHFGEMPIGNHGRDQSQIRNATSVNPQSVEIVRPAICRPSDDDVRRLRERARVQTLLMRSLKRLVGPNCGQKDLLLTSQAAFDAARAYLLWPSPPSRPS